MASPSPERASVTFASPDTEGGDGDGPPALSATGSLPATPGSPPATPGGGPPPMKRAMSSFILKTKSKFVALSKRLKPTAAVDEDEVLRLLRRDITDADLEEFWTNVDYNELTTWSLAELRTACAARRLEQHGRKITLIDRLLQRAVVDKKRRLRSALEAELTEMRENEADGGVYCVGQGYGSGCKTWDRLFVRNNLTAIQALSGIGVVDVVLGFDSSVCLALCNNGELWSWAMLAPNNRGPVGYTRQLKFDVASREEYPTVQMARFTPAKVGSTPVGVAAIPFRLPVRPRATQKKPRRFKHLRAADGVPTEAMWVTEESVARAEEVRKAEADNARKTRLRKRRDRRDRLRKAGFDTDSDSDDFGEDLLGVDDGMGEALPPGVTGEPTGSAGSFPEGRLPKAVERPVIDTGAPGQRLAERSGDRPPPAVDEGKSWFSLRMGIVKSRLKDFAMDKLKNTKWAAKKKAYEERKQLQEERRKRDEGTAPKPPAAEELLVREVGANDDWDNLKHTHERFDPEEESKRTVKGGEDWWKFENLRQVVVKEMIDPAFVPTMPIDRLTGEVPVALASSSTHVVVVTKGGDMYTWGSPEGGMLGLGAVTQYQEDPILIRDIPAEKKVIQVSCGLLHTAALCDDGELFVWGYPGDGRLGLGDLRSYGPAVQLMDPMRRSGHKAPDVPLGVTVPTVVGFFASNRILVKSVVCGAAHTLAVTIKGVFAWGCGDGGRLGVGDQRSRNMPTEVEAFRGMHVKQVDAGPWHSAAVVIIPPLMSGGWVYTWGRGLHGQLGQGGIIRQSNIPMVVTELLESEQIIKKVSCGSFHMGALSDEGELWTWGKNDFNCLGRPGSMSDIGDPEFTGVPGKVETLREYGVGPIVSFACGNKTTVIATEPYKPLPPYKVRERARLDLAREKQSEALYEKAHNDARANRSQQAAMARKVQLKELNLARPLCAICTKCTGFQPQLFSPYSCDTCGHDRKAHTRQRILLPGQKPGK